MLVYLASYPRSGNRWSMDLLKHYFGLQSLSVYEQARWQRAMQRYGAELVPPEENGGTALLTPELRERIAGASEVVLLKTHEPPFAQYFRGEKVVHIVRHPGAATWSYYHFLRDVDHFPADLDGVVHGDYGFGSWSVHAEAWLAAGARLGSNYLRYSYEQMHAEHARICADLAAYLGLPLREPVGSFPAFEHWHNLRPQHARRGSVDEWETHFTPAQRRLLVTCHGPTMAKLGYPTTLPLVPQLIDQTHGLLTRTRHTLGTKVNGLRRRQARFTGWVRGRLRPEQNLPLVLHITQHKAGSQWVAEILKNIAAPERIVLPQENGAHFTSAQLRPGAVVLTIYRPYAKVQAVTAGYTGPIRRFVVIRDLRDTLVSLYYSLRYSHPPQAIVIKNREALAHLDTEQGMMALLTLDPRSLWAQAEIAAPVRMKASESAGVQPEHNILDRIAHLQRSWLEVEDRLLVRYEDLVADEHGMFQRIVDYCAIEVPPARLYDVVAQNSFAVKTGRRVGQEDINSHQRKGIVGDWRNCFTDELKAEFKARYGEHLIATGYERDLNW